MKKLDKEQLEAVKSFFGISSDMMVTHLKEKGLIKEEFEIDKWYRRGDDFIYYTCEFMNYGIIDGQWRNDLYFSTAQEQLYIPATDKEVEEALIKEAKKRGFKEGVKFNGVDRVGINGVFKGSDCVTGSYFRHNTYPKENVLLTNGIAIFSNGKWAEIVEQTPLEVIINGETYIKK